MIYVSNNLYLKKYFAWFGLLLSFLILTAIQSSVSGLSKVLESQEHFSMNELSRLSSLFYLTWLLGAVIAGAFVDYYGIRKMAIISNFISIVCFSFLSYTDTELTLFITRGFLGLAMSISIIVIMSYIRLNFQSRTYALLVGSTTCSSIMFAAFAAGPLEIVVNSYGLNIIFQIMLIINILALIFILFFVHVDNIFTNISIKILVSSYYSLIKDKKFISFIICLSTAGLVRGTIGSMYELPWLLRQHPSALVFDSAIVFTLLISNAVGQVILPLIADYFKKIKPFVLLFLSGIPIGVILLAFVKSKYLLWPIVIALGFLSGNGNLGGLYIKYHTDEGLTGSAFALFGIIGGLCVMVTLNLGGYIMTLYPKNSDLPYIVIYSFIALLQILGLIYYWYYHKPIINI